MRRLHQSSEDGDLPTFKFIEINGMKLTDPMQAYTQIWQVRVWVIARFVQLTCEANFCP